MKIKYLFLTIAALSLFVMSGFAAATVCTSYPKGPSPAPANTAIAVASNFAGPAVDMLTRFQPNNTTMLLCENSTAHLLAEIQYGTEVPAAVLAINPTAPYYGLFFAADGTAATQFPSNSTSYARGIPVIFGYSDLAAPYTVTVANNLISGTSPSEDHDTVTVSGAALAAGYGIGTGAQSIAVANPSAAPYGAAAEEILEDLNSYLNPPVFPNAFDNITLTKNAVGTSPVVSGTTYDIKSAFISKAQICRQMNVVWVEFTNPAYTLLQTVALLNTSPTSDAYTLYQAILTAKTNDTWEDFLDYNCYQMP